MLFAEFDGLSQLHPAAQVCAVVGSVLVTIAFIYFFLYKGLCNRD